MKPKNFYREIGRPNPRQMGAGHELGNLGRLRAKLPSPAVVGERASWKSSRLLLGLAGMSVVAMLVILWMFLRVPPPQRVPSQVASAPLSMGRQAGRVDTEFLAPSESDAVAMVKRALSLRDPAMVSQEIRLGDASAEEAIEYFSKLTEHFGAITAYHWQSSMNQGPTMIEGVKISFEKDYLKKQRLALLTPDAQGVWQLDYESFARRVSPSWDTILRGDAAVAKVRVILGRDLYFNGPFTEEAWVCYSFSSPDVDAGMHGYCRKGSSEDRALAALLGGGDPLYRVVLEIRRIGGAGRRQFEISKLIAVDWLVPSKL